MVVQRDVGALLVIVFIADFAHDFLDDIFHGHQARRAAKLVHHDGDMDFVGLEVTQKLVYHLCLGHEIGRTNQGLPTEIVAFGQVRQQVLNIKDALDVVPRLTIHGDTRIDILHDALQHVLERRMQLQVHHIQPRSHDFLGCFLTKADDSFQDFVFFRTTGFVGHQSAHRQRGHFLPNHIFVHQRGRAQQHGCQGINRRTTNLHPRSGHTAKRQCLVGRQHLRRQFAHQQEQEGKDYRQHHELHPRHEKMKYLKEKEVAEDNGGHTRQIVRYQQGGP